MAVSLESKIDVENDLKNFIMQLEKENNRPSQKVRNQFEIERSKESSSGICFYIG